MLAICSRVTRTRFRGIFIGVSHLGLILLLLLFAGCKNEKKSSKLPTSSSTKLKAAQTKRPNVFFIIIDSLRADHLGAYGYSKGTSPHLDAFSKDAVVFSRAYATAPWTLPSIASMVTGYHPYVLGIREDDVVIDKNVRTLAEVLKSDGYRTAGIVSHIYLHRDFGMMQGFDHLNTRHSLGHEGISSPGLSTRGIQYVDKHRNKPMFVLLHYFDPHYNFIMHPHYLNYFPEYKGALKTNMDIHAFRGVVKESPPEMHEDNLKYLNALYDSEINLTDVHIGRFIDHLKSTGLYENSMIIVAGDHGEELGDRKPMEWIGHSIVTSEEVIRVPLLVKMPGTAKGKRWKENVSLVDVAATIMNTIGVPNEKWDDFPGKPLNLDQPGKNEELIFCETGKSFPMQVAVYKDWKMVHRTYDDSYELYNLKTDPKELINVISDYPKQHAHMKKALVKWNKDMARDRKKVNPKMKAPGLSKQNIDVMKALGYILD